MTKGRNSKADLWKRWYLMTVMFQSPNYPMISYMSLADHCAQEMSSDIIMIIIV